MDGIAAPARRQSYAFLLLRRLGTAIAPSPEIFARFRRFSDASLGVSVVPVERHAISFRSIRTLQKFCIAARLSTFKPRKPPEFLATIRALNVAKIEGTVAVGLVVV